MKKILTILIAVVVLASAVAAVEGSTTYNINKTQTNNNTQDGAAGPQILLSTNRQIGVAVAVETGDNTFVGGNVVGSNYSEETSCEPEEITMNIDDSQTNENTQTEGGAVQFMGTRNTQLEVTGSLLTDDNTIIIGNVVGSSNTKTCAPTDGGDNGDNGDNGNGGNGNGGNGNGRPGLA